MRDIIQEMIERACKKTARDLNLTLNEIDTCNKSKQSKVQINDINKSH